MSPSKHVYQGMSPHPSDVNVEYVDTIPGTHLTAFSSDRRSGPSNHETSLGFTSPDPSATVYRLGSKYEDKDPFISPGAKVRPEQKLSATASAFQPFNIRLNQGSIHSTNNVRGNVSDTTISAKLKNEDSHLMDPNSPSDSIDSGIVQLGTFSTDTRVTRAIRIFGIYMPVSREQVETCLQEKGIPEKATRRFYHSVNEVLVRFSDVQDAVIIYNYTKISHPEWSVDYITPSACAEKSNPGSPFVSAHEGQVALVAKLPGVGGFDIAKIEDIIVDLLAVDGAVYAYQKQLTTETGTVRMIAEFCDVGSAHRAVARLNGAVVRGISLNLGLHKPDIDQRPSRNAQIPQHTPIRGREDYNDLVGSIGRMSITSTPAYGQQAPFPYPTLMSPTGRSYVPGGYPMTPGFSSASLPFGAQFSSPQTPVTGYTPGGYCTPSQYGSASFTSGSTRLKENTPIGQTWDSMGSPTRGGSKELSLSQERPNGRRQNAVRGTSRPPFGNTVGQHNVVDVNRIRQGLDVRTTIMLRNIPNKIDQQMLKGIIDETSFGLYDFMYLRIDFANNCNVGYAFINFEDPWHIINFVEARAGQRWNRYNSDKVAEVSYATIQGKDCLVQKFRNSSVMLEHPTFRPKIFRTGNHPGAGEEEDFPLPDNASKMRRSVENAEHVGLFAPRAGQHYRDEQRRRRSQYDRGTRLAALEEFEYEDSMSYPGGGHYSY